MRVTKKKKIKGQEQGDRVGNKIMKRLPVKYLSYLISRKEVSYNIPFFVPPDKMSVYLS